MTEKVFGTEKKGSIRDIPLPTENSSANKLDLQNKNSENFDNWSQMKRKNKRFGSKIIGFILLCLIGAGIYSFLFHSAEVTVTSASEQVTIASREFNSALNPSDDQVAFTRVNPYKKTETLYVEGSEEENKQTKTTGTITVYNTDSQPKTYIKNTRFQTESGLVYRAFKKFVIPAGTEENPGSTEVVIVAENPGEKYNSQSGATFKLPALKEQNNPSYDLVYASQTEPLEGGFSGVIRVPTEDDIEEAKTKLRATIELDLEKGFAESLPDNYIVNKDYISVSDVVFIEKPNSEKGGLDIEAQATLESVVFEKEIFDLFMAKQLLEDYQTGKSYVIDNIPELTMELQGDIDPATVEEFSFTVSGNVAFRSPVDVEEVKKLVSGNLKSHITSGLVTGLETVNIKEVSVSPFWRRTLPGNAEQITVTVEE